MHFSVGGNVQAQIYLQNTGTELFSELISTALVTLHSFISK